MTKIDHQNVIHYDYQWDVANRVVSINDSKYNYDKTSQLIAANYDKLPVEKYTYDLNGNRSNYRTGKNNQLIHEGENMYEYDGEGNRISKGTTKYFWDHRNRLVKVETPQKTVEYVYDHKNRLVKRSTSKGTEYFIHDGWQVVLTLNQHGKANNYFLWGVNQDELIAQNEYYSLCDHLGTVRHLVGKGVVAHFEYNAFGQLLSKTGNTDCVFKYTGKMTDDVTGLQWNINRWYDSNVGRWISEDPIEFRGKNLNLYGYTNNKVINYFDPNGHMNLGAIKLGWEIAGFLTTGLSIFDLLSGPSFGTSVYSGTEFGHRYFQLDVEDISSSIATIDQQLSGNIPMPTPYGTTVVQFFGPDTITLEFNLELQEIDTFTSQIFVSIQDSRTFTRQEIESFRDIPTGRIRAAYSVDLSFKMRLPARNAIFEVSHYSPGTAFSPIGSTEEWCSKKVQINANSKLRVYGQSTTVSGSLSYSYSHSIDVIDQATSVGNFEVHN
ncbi:MAG: RHS repeat-associated core domain-containing protein [Planctomycetaceae bacterium]|nr:RHS repeat-associated core domain-containing protein [Planctomycetaceae bacterium]